MAKTFIRNGVFYWSQERVQKELNFSKLIEVVDFIVIQHFSETPLEDYSLLTVTLSKEWLTLHQLTDETFYRIIESRVNEIYNIGEYFEGSLNDVTETLDKLGYCIAELAPEVFSDLYPCRATLPITIIPTHLGLGAVVPTLHSSTLEPGFTLYRFQRVEENKLLVASVYTTTESLRSIEGYNWNNLSFENVFDCKLFERYLSKYYGTIYTRDNIGKRGECSMFIWELDTFMEDGQSEYTINNWEYVDCKPLTKEKLMELPIKPFGSYALQKEKSVSKLEFLEKAITSQDCTDVEGNDITEESLFWLHEESDPEEIDFAYYLYCNNFDISLGRIILNALHYSPYELIGPLTSPWS